MEGFEFKIGAIYFRSFKIIKVHLSEDKEIGFQRPMWPKKCPCFNEQTNQNASEKQIKSMKTGSLSTVAG